MKFIFFLALNIFFNEATAQFIKQNNKSIILNANKALNNLYYNEAISLYKRAYENDKSNSFIIEKIAECYWNLRDFSNSLYWFELLEIKTDELLLKYVDVLKATGQYSKAILVCKNQLNKKGDNSILFKKLNEIENIDKIIFSKTKYVLSNINFNSSFRDFCPIFYDSGLAFVSSRPLTNRNTLGRNYNYRNTHDFEYCKIFTINNLNYTKYSIDSFETLKNINFGNGKVHLLLQSDHNVGPITLSNDLKTIYYTKNIKRRNKDSKLEILKSTIINGKISYPESFLYNEKNFSVEHPAISPDNKFLYFSSNKPRGFGGFDIYRCEKDSVGNWMEPINLGSLINTSGNEVFPYVDALGDLYFSSDFLPGYGALDIFFVNLGNETLLQKPINLGPQINSAFDDYGITLNSTKSFGFFSSNRLSGNDDIYRIDRIDSIYIKTIVLDYNSGIILDSANVTLNDTISNISSRFITNKNEKFVTIWEKELQLKVNASKDGYIDYQQYVDTKELDDHQLFIRLKLDDSNLKIPIDSSILKTIDTTSEIEKYPYHLEVGRKVINFDFNFSTIRNVDKKELDTIIRFLDVNPNLNIVIAGFTDCKGDKKLNQKLALSRANQVRLYLVNNGINKKRIFNEHFGKQYFILACTEDTTYNKAIQINNRRSEMIITSDKNPKWYPSKDVITEDNSILSIIRSQKASKKIFQLPRIKNKSRTHK